MPCAILRVTFDFDAILEKRVQTRAGRGAVFMTVEEAVAAYARLP